MGKRQVFIKEANRIGTEIDYVMNCDELLLKIFGLKTLELLLQSCIEDENYESAAIIQNELNKRKKNK